MNSEWPSARPLEDYIDFIYGQLAQLNSPLNDRSPGSGLYTLVRSIAATFADVDVQLYQTALDASPATAIGKQLEMHARDYGLERQPGQPARGYVLARALSDPVQLPDPLVLTNPQSTLQYRVESGAGRVVTALSETRLTVVCTQPGRAGNLLAGARLIHPELPSVSFVVGAYRTPEGVEGNLEGGQEPESDESLRQRLFQLLLYRSSGTPAALLGRLRMEEGILWADVTTPTPGVATFWVESLRTLSSSELARLQAALEEQRPAGIVYRVAQVKRLEIEIGLRVQPQPGTDLDQLSSQLRSQVNTYLQNLRIQQQLRPQELAAYLQEQVPAAAIVEVIQPSQELQPPKDTVLRTAQVALTFV